MSKYQDALKCLSYTGYERDRHIETIREALTLAEKLENGYVLDALPDGYDIYCIGRDHMDGYWLEVREIESGKLARDIGMRIIFADTLPEAFTEARAMINAAEKGNDDE